MRYHIKKTLVVVVACCFIFLGVIGLVLPVLQGVLFLVIGLLLLSMYDDRVRDFVYKTVEKYPHLRHLVNKTEALLRRIVGQP